MACLPQSSIFWVVHLGVPTHSEESRGHVLQVAGSSRQAADRVGVALLGSLMKSAEHSLSPSSDRSATDCSLAVISTIVRASQEVYASGQDERRPEDVPQQGVHDLTVHSGSPSTAAAGAGTQPLAGRGPELLDIALRSATACTQQHRGVSSTGPEDMAPGDMERHGSSNGLQHSLPPTYPMHELEASEGRLPSISPQDMCGHLNSSSRGCSSLCTS